LPTKEITRLLKSQQLSNKSSSFPCQDSEQITLEVFVGLNQFNTNEEDLQVEQTPQILHQPYGIPGSSKNN
jgi:hypothetical protein